MEAARAEAPLRGTRQLPSTGAAGSSPCCPAHLFPAPPFPSLLFQSAPVGIPGKVLGGSKYPPLGTCPLKELGHFGRVFLLYVHFPFLPSTLLLTRISPSPLRRCRSHVVPIFLQKNPIKSFQAAPNTAGPGAALAGRTVSSSPGAGVLCPPPPAPPAPHGSVEASPVLPWGVQPQEGAGMGWPSSCYPSRDDP